MLGASAVPGLLLFAVALAAPKSPRWLMMMRRRPEAAAELRKIRLNVDVEPRLDAIEAALRQEGDRASWGEVFHQEWRRPLMIGIGLAVFQQITGINAIIYYADQIFSSAGFTTPAGQTTVTTWAIGAVNVLATLIAIAFIDRLGRRKLLLAGLIGMGISLIVVGIAFRFIAKGAGGAAAAAGPSGAGVVTLLALVGFIICFAFSIGPVVWTVINEVFPGPGGRCRHGGQLGFGLPGQPVLPVADRRDRRFVDVLAVRAVLRRCLDLDILPCAGDQGTAAGTDPATLDGAGQVMLIAGDVGGAATRLISAGFARGWVTWRLFSNCGHGFHRRACEDRRELLALQAVAPPTSAPPTSGSARIARALGGLTEPP
jgi:MFS family permease